MLAHTQLTQLPSLKVMSMTQDNITAPVVTSALHSPAVACANLWSASLQVAQLPSLKAPPESDLDEHHLDSLIASIDMADATIWTSALFDRTKLPPGPAGEGKEKRLTVLSSIDQPALVSTGSPWNRVQGLLSRPCPAYLRTCALE